MFHLIAAGVLLTSTTFAQISPTTPPQPSALEIFVRQPTTRIISSSEVGRFESGDTIAVFKVIIAEETEPPSRRMTGLEIDLANASIRDQVYVSDAELEELRTAVNDIERSVNRNPNRECNAKRYCFTGAEAFWNPSQPPKHTLSFAYYFTPGGERGLSLSASLLLGQFNFPGQQPAQLRDVIDRAIERLKD